MENFVFKLSDCDFQFLIFYLETQTIVFIFSSFLKSLQTMDLVYIFL